MDYFTINTLPGTSWPALPLPQFSLALNAYQILEKTQWGSSKQIEEFQIHQINSLLDHCYKNSLYYRKVLINIKQYNNPIDNLNSFRKIPLLTRYLYQSNFDQIKSSKLPIGMEEVSDPIFTSGTDGTPITVHKTNLDNIWWQAFAMRDFEWNKMNPLKKIAAIRLLAMTPKDLPQALNGVASNNWLPPVGGLSLFKSGPAYGMDIRQDPYKQIEWLQKIKPSYLISLPSNLEVLASILQEKKEIISSLELIQIIGEPLTDDLKYKIESAFQVPVCNLYSANECGYIASTCPSGDGLHVHAENVFAEVLDSNNNPCNPGETGRLILTSLNNYVTPFIRYDIGDEVTLADKPCSCGRGLPLWKHVDGRRHPMLFLQDGRRKASTGLMLGIRQIGGIHQFQVVQKDVNHFIVNVVPNEQWTPHHGNSMISFIKNEVESDAEVEIRGYKTLEKNNGKLKIIVVENE